MEHDLSIDMDCSDSSSMQESSEDSHESGEDNLTEDKVTENERQFIDCFSDIETEQDVFSLISSVESPQKQSTSETINASDLQVQQFDITTPLYPNSAITLFQSLILLLLYAIRNALSAKGITELLHLFKVHLPPGTKLPSTVHTLRQYFIRAYPECKGDVHTYCSICHRILPAGEVACDIPGCEGKLDYFICSQLDLQVKRLMEDPHTWKLLQKRFDRQRDGIICDIYDGAAYIKHETFLSNQANISFTLNTDGVALYRSSKVGIWPIWLVVNELPPSERFSKRNMILGGLWYSKDKPTMSTYLRPLVEAINHLYTAGLKVSTPGGLVCTRAMLLTCAFDLPARALVLDMKQFNGKYACVYCEDEGQTPPGDHLHRFWPHNPHNQRRTHESLLQNATEATLQHDTVKGVKGVSVLFLHQPCDLATTCVVDDLHCVYLGVSKTLLHLWLDKSNSKEPFYIGKKVSQCDERLLHIKVPDVVSRVPRSLVDIAHWKGSEHRNWILFYAIPVLQGILPCVYLTHLSLLTSALHCLSSEHITPVDLANSRQWLLTFYKDFSTLYGKQHTTMNIHLISHLADCVSNWGPLWAYSCFAYESMNGTLKKLFHGTCNMSKQMLFSYTMMQLLPSVTLLNPTKPVQLLADIFSGKQCISHKQCLSEEVIAVGGTSLCHLEGEMLQLINTCLEAKRCSPILPCTAQIFYRLKLRKQLLYCSQYGKVKKRNSYTISYQSSTGQVKFGLIKCYIYCDHTFAVVTQLKKAGTCKQQFKIDSDALDISGALFPVTAVGDDEIIFAEQILSKCMHIDIVEHQYIATFSCSCVVED